jgi:hypothetical protein
MRLSANGVTDAASDPYAALQIYSVLEEHRLSLKPTPPRPYFAELGLPIRLAEGVGMETDSEEDDSEEPVSEDPKNAAQFSDDILTAASESVEVEEPCETSAEIASKTSKSAAPATKAVFRVYSDERIVQGDSWQLRYRNTHPICQCGPAALRAYQVWYANEDLSPPDIAKLLRDPPLQTRTVASYILEAVNFERLPYSIKRLREEVVVHVSEDIIARKYWGINRAIMADKQAAKGDDATTPAGRT